VALKTTAQILHLHLSVFSVSKAVRQRTV